MSSERNTSNGGSSARRKVWKPPTTKKNVNNDGGGGDASIPSLFAAASLMTKPKHSTPYRDSSGRTGAGTSANTSNSESRNTASSKAGSATPPTPTPPPSSSSSTGGTRSIKSNDATTQRHITTTLSKVPPDPPKSSDMKTKSTSKKHVTSNISMMMASKPETSIGMKKKTTDEVVATAETTTTTTTTAKLSSTPTATRNSTKSISMVPQQRYSVVGVQAGSAHNNNSTGTGDLGGKIPSSKTTTTTTTTTATTTTTTTKKNWSPRRFEPTSPSKVVSPYSSKTQRQSLKKKHWLEKDEDEEIESENVVSSPSGTSQLLLSTSSSNKSDTSPIMSPEDQSKFVKENWHILKSLMMKDKEEPDPTPIIDLEDSKKALWKLKEAQWDNQSVSSEAERLEIEERALKGRQAADEEEIQAKIKDLYGTTDLDEVLISDKDDIRKYNLYSDSDDDSVE